MRNLNTKDNNLLPIIKLLYVNNTHGQNQELPKLGVQNSYILLTQRRCHVTPSPELPIQAD